MPDRQQNVLDRTGFCPDRWEYRGESNRNTLSVSISRFGFALFALLLRSASTQPTPPSDDLPERESRPWLWQEHHSILGNTELGLYEELVIVALTV